MESGNQRRNTSSSSSSLPLSRGFTSNNSKNTKISRFDRSTMTNNAPNCKSNQLDASARKNRRGSSTSSITLHEKGKTRGEEDDSSSFPVLVGTCPFMCPEGERIQRERLRDLAVFERLHGNPGKTSPSLAVKKCKERYSLSRFVSFAELYRLSIFKRLMCGHLEDTLSYLLDLEDSTEHPFLVVHDFIFDRTRSIRQDLSMQNIVNDNAINMYEKMVKFHVASHLKLRSYSSKTDISSVHHLNMEQLIKALTSLYNLYDASRNRNSIYENEAEFRSLYVLLHLDSKGQPMGESLSLWFRHVPLPIIKSRHMCFARSVLRSFRMGNYRRFFATIAAEASYLQYCIIEPYINEVRAQSLSCINSVGYKLHPYPLVKLSELIVMKESDLELLCKACGLETYTDEMGNKLLPTKQTTFCIPKGGLHSSNFPGLEQFEK